MGIKGFLRNFVLYLKDGGITYADICYRNPSRLLEGRNIAITGGSSGIGYAIASKCIKEGAHVAIIARDEKRLRAAQEKLGENCLWIAADQSGNVDGLLEEARSRMGGHLDGLVNNAGVYIDHGNQGYSMDEWDLVINTNLRGPFFLTKQYEAYCKENSVKGNVVFVASNRGLYGDTGPYGISKNGLIHYMYGMARELIKNGIRINAIAPGMTATEINHIDPEDNLYMASCRGKRVILPDEIAEVAVFLLSDISRSVVGAVVPCDEGDYLR